MSHAASFVAPEPKDLAPHFPNYAFKELIACGGMGAVYRARQITLDRDVAIKILPREFGKDRAFREGFSAEAKAMARLNHPNLIGVHDCGEVDGMLFIIMEFVPGPSLYQLANGKAMEPRKVAKLMADICAGVADAHANRILHRDIKPANILLDMHENPKIGDFGLARPIGHAAAEGEAIFGTPHYTAPEVVDKPAAVGPRADIFSLGVLLHELLTGKLPASDPRPPSAISGCPRGFDAIVQCATHPHPAFRYEDAAAMGRDLAGLANNAHGPKLVTGTPSRAGATRPAPRATNPAKSAPSSASRAGATRPAPRATALPVAKSTPASGHGPLVPTFTPPKPPAPTPGFPKPATAALRQKSHVRKVINHTSSPGIGLGWVITAVLVFIAIVIILTLKQSGDTAPVTVPAPEAVPEPLLPEGISRRETGSAARPEERGSRATAARVPMADVSVAADDPLAPESRETLENRTHQGTAREGGEAQGALTPLSQPEQPMPGESEATASGAKDTPPLPAGNEGQPSDFDTAAFLARARDIMRGKAAPEIASRNESLARNFDLFERRVSRNLRDIDDREIRKDAEARTELAFTTLRQKVNKIPPFALLGLPFIPGAEATHAEFLTEQLQIEETFASGLQSLRKIYIQGIELQIRRLDAVSQAEAVMALRAEIEKTSAKNSYISDMLTGELPAELPDPAAAVEAPADHP